MQKDIGRGTTQRTLKRLAGIFMDILIIYCLYSYQWEFIPIKPYYHINRMVYLDADTLANLDGY